MRLQRFLQMAVLAAASLFPAAAGEVKGDIRIDGVGNYYQGFLVFPQYIYSILGWYSGEEPRTHVVVRLSCEGSPVVQEIFGMYQGRGIYALFMRGERHNEKCTFSITPITAGTTQQFDGL